MARIKIQIGLKAPPSFAARAPFDTLHRYCPHDTLTVTSSRGRGLRSLRGPGRQLLRARRRRVVAEAQPPVDGVDPFQGVRQVVRLQILVAHGDVRPRWVLLHATALDGMLLFGRAWHLGSEQVSLLVMSVGNLWTRPGECNFIADVDTATWHCAAAARTAPKISVYVLRRDGGNSGS